MKNFPSLYHMLKAAASDHPSRPHLHYDGRWRSYRETLDRAERIAFGLRSLGWVVVFG